MKEIVQAIIFRLQQVLWTIVTVISLIKDRITYDWDERYIQTKTVRLHYVQTGGDDKPLLLMLHGFPEFWYSWRYQLKHFADKYRCIALDQRGYNLSGKPIHTEDYHIDYLIDDIREVVEGLGYKKCFLMGHDWGAIVAWQFALVYPELVEKLVILNVPHPLAFPATNFEQMRKSWYVFFFQTPMLPEMAVRSRDLHMFDLYFRARHAGIRNKENFTDEDLEAFKHVFSQEGALTGPINYYRNITKRVLQPGQRICKPPTLIVWGDQDAFLVKEGATNSLKFCENGHLIFLKGTSHWVMQDEPEKVNRYVEEFLSGSGKSKKCLLT
ncbi:unnamed protein product [Cylicocyclus nassatus]|uniref:AB hydrolase-1 domain-containing protein n=1 Tax=Cylicocyclus nassatus TaxID=53992 RepID=A0AA36DS59_CYLNA|nr:unnamed protein product [Cylicocyclus nassatus]